LAILCLQGVAKDTPIVGFADTHMHLVAELGFGGHFFWGAHNGTLEESFAPCDGRTTHGWPFDLFGKSTVSRIMSCDDDEQVTHADFTHGEPDFSHWPRWSSTSHHQAHSSQLKAAWKGGLRLVFITAMTDTFVCGLAEAVELKLPQNKKRQTCNVTRALEEQVEAIWLWAGQESDWVEVALTAGDARRIAASGKLAVVISVEASYALGYGNEYIAQLERYHKMGVRQIIFVHMWDNQFGGATFYDKSMELGDIVNWLRDLLSRNKAASATAASALADEVAVQLRTELLSFCPVKWAHRLKRLGQWFHSDPGSNTPLPHTDKNGFNKLGLTAQGKEVVQWMMRNNMFVDLAHLSRKAIDDVYKLSVEHGYYPLMMSHGFASDAQEEADRSEWSAPVSVLTMIQTTGGTFGVRPLAGSFRTYTRSNVTNNCYGSTRSLAQEVDLLTDIGFSPVFGSDFNGWAIQTLPRAGSAEETCSGHANNLCKKPKSKACAQAKATMAKQQKAQSGSSSAELDRKGLAHVGLLPALLQDMQALGGKVSGLMNGAEAVVQMWERIDAGAAARKPLQPPVSDLQAYMDAHLLDVPV